MKLSDGINKTINANKPTYDEHCNLIIPILQSLGMDYANRVEFLFCFSGEYTYEEVSFLMRKLGQERSAQVIEVDYDQHRNRVIGWIEQNGLPHLYQNEN